MFRSAIKRLLEMERDIAVIAETGRGDDVLPMALRCRPNVAVLDVEMPGVSGVDAARELLQHLPGCRSLIVTSFARPGFLQRALANGAAGFVLKDDPIEVLVEAIRRCAGGEKVLNLKLAAEAMKLGASPLTERDCQVLVETVRGASVEDIAKTLYMSEGTVRNKISNSISKLHARNRADAVRIATQNGWIQVPREE
jgi:two-component system response regulator DesR